MAACASDIDGSKSQLNKSYAALSKAVPPESLPSLEKAQRTWLAYRNAECAFQGANPGTMGSSDQVACVADLNRLRAKDLTVDAVRWKP